MSNRSPYVTLACNTCRKRKRKCDGRKPCYYCSRGKTHCVYDPQNDRRRNKTNVEYLEYLETRNLNLISFIKKLMAKEPNNVQLQRNAYELLADNDTNSFKFEQTESLIDENAYDIAHSDNPSNLAIDELVGMTWKLQLDPDGSTKFLGPSSNQVPYSHARTPSHNHNTSDLPNDYQAGFGDRTKYDYYMNEVLLDKEFLKCLCSIFEANLCSFITCLQDIHLTVLFEEYCNGPHASSSNVLPNSSILLLYAVFAYGYNLLPSNNKQKTYLSGENMFLVELETSLLTLLSGKSARGFDEDLKVIYILLILTCMYLGNHDEKLSWTYNALLCSRVHHTGLHVSTSIPESYLDFIEDEKETLEKKRSRAFWSCALVDRIATNILGRCCIIHYKRILTPFYVSDYTVSHDLGDLIFQYNTKLWYLHDKFSDQIYSFQFSSYDKALCRRILNASLSSLEGFVENLPVKLQLRLQDDDPKDSRLLLLHLTLNVSLLMIYRPFLKMLPQSRFEECLEICRRCVLLINLLDETLNVHDYPFYYGFLVSTVSVFLILVLTLFRKETSLESDLILTLKSLKEGSEVWPSYSSYLRTIYEHARECHVNEKLLKNIKELVQSRGVIDSEEESGSSTQIYPPLGFENFSFNLDWPSE
ncbi:hypothetical protein N7582_005411 [Saccharomyces uvarum]|uniref:Zn(2)-C6 fungal-type domain-containing protein n=1 Tax=Saccharomyces uvarum TaxID=230603 RepID=A0AA35J840_SACUV|nr:hypothetical protein N7582_005411 [Saccharomyces uvarum]CAI4052278.1 hypothetical protein SUVC_15G3770 [Saccharomyces uvarum]